jgi:hypothetical protein
MHVRSNRQLVRLAFDIDRRTRKAQGRKVDGHNRPAAQHSTLQANYFIAS